MRGVCVAMLLGVGAGAAQTQPGALGTVSTTDASVTAPTGDVVTVSAGLASIGGINTVTALPGRNAEVHLTRGGSVLVCQTSGLHLAGSDAGALLMALDRGAMEIHMKPAEGDVLMTPDLRFTLEGGNALDLRLRVSFNGDTCVENRGHKAPLLKISDTFGEASYEVKPGQHVLFEHGSLREVVDRETTPCGCPPGATSKVSIAEAALSGRPGSKKAKQAEAEHPFPAAQSAGLAPPTPVAPETPEGGTHVQVATTLKYDPAHETAAAGSGGAAGQAAATPEVEATAAPTSASTSAPAPARKQGPFGAVGRFFKRMFVR